MAEPTPMSDDERRQLAAVAATLNAHLTHCTESSTLFRADMKELRSDVAAIKDSLAQAKGGWKALAASGTIGGAIVAAAMKFLPAAH